MRGDYCMGIEPKESTVVSFLISSGWLTIADWRIALSNIGGLIGTVFYAIAALSFIEYLKCKPPFSPESLYCFFRRNQIWHEKIRNIKRNL